MSTIMPEGDAVKNAIKWISEHVKEDPQANLNKLVNEAIFKFDLSPKQGQFMINFYNEQKTQKDD